MTAWPRSVLAAVDFGDASARAIAAAGALAERSEANLRLLHAEAMEAPPYFTTEQVQQLEGQRRALRTQAQQLLSRFGHTHTACPFSMVLADPPADEAILREAASADIVVMGTHGRRGPTRWWLGSVAERVLRDIARPLLIIRADAPEPARGLFGRVLVQASPELAGTAALTIARNLARLCGGEAIDARLEPIEHAVWRTLATIVVVATPQPRTAQWLARHGEPHVRFSPIPILFVPDVSEGALP